MTILLNQPEQEYRDAPGLNFSRLKLMEISPLAFKRSRPTSKAFALGSACHAAILEPEAFNTRYTVLPSEFSQRRGAAYQAWADNDGREVLLRAEYDVALAASVASRKAPKVRAQLEHADTEVSVFTTFRGVPVKARLDWAGPEGLGDLKTVANMDLGKFFRQCVSLHYLAQFAWYLDVYTLATGADNLSPSLRAVPFSSVVVEKTEPFDMTLVRFTASDLDYGRREYTKWFDRYLECAESGLWPGVGDEVQFEMPFYAVDDEIEGAPEDP